MPIAEKTVQATDTKLGLINDAYPDARVVPIAGVTYRVNIWTKSAGIIPVNVLRESFLVDVVGGIVIRRPEATKKLVRYSDKWK